MNKRGWAPGHDAILGDIEEDLLTFFPLQKLSISIVSSGEEERGGMGVHDTFPMSPLISYFFVFLSNKLNLCLFFTSGLIDLKLRKH